MTLYFLTGNEDKLREAKLIFPEIEGLNIDLLEIQSMNTQEIIKHKLEEARKKHDGNFIVEDTSLYIECLNDLPGPLIKWFMKTLGYKGIYNIVKNFDNKKAIAKCIIGFSRASKVEYFEGAVHGKIVEPEGTGFGWDPIFQPENHDKTFGQMTAEEKNRISMRKLAFEKLKEYLEQNYKDL